MTTKRTKNSISNQSRSSSKEDRGEPFLLWDKIRSRRLMLILSIRIRTKTTGRTSPV
jgi:hypothetical protein